MWNARAIGRLLTGRTGRLPDFLCIGAQKAGTTTLHELLREHPGVHLSPEKEVQYFSLNFDRPLGWYRSRFADARRRQRVGETSPYYLFHPEAPARIAATLPDVRLIVLVRDPVERALSGYFHSLRAGQETLPVEAAFEAEERRLAGSAAALAAPGGRHESHRWHGYLGRSRYEEQLARYRSLFPASRLLVIRSEDLFADPRPVLHRVHEFLGLDPRPPGDTAGPRNAGKGEAGSVAASFRAALRKRLQPTYDAMRRDDGIEWPAPEGGSDDA